MRVWVKEFETVCTIKSVSMLLKKNVEMYKFTTIEKINVSDILIVSKNDCSILSMDLSRIIVLFYEEVRETIFSNVVQEYQNKVDYFYLENALKHATSFGIETIITGSSYGLYGIEASLLSKEVNLSLPSQDLYYSFKGICKTYKENSSIRNVVLCCGYYYFHTDLSQTKNLSEISRISKVYNPVYKDMHNCVFLPPNPDLLLQSAIFDVNSILDDFASKEYQRHYFNKQKLRKIDKIKEWNELSNSEKIMAAKKRTLFHNKSLKRDATFLENASLFQELAEFCSRNNINLVVVVTPVSKYYLEYLDAEYKNKFFQVLNEIESTIHLLDLSDDSSFDEYDFMDTDHLNEKGAGKMTQIILNTLQQINREEI